MPNKETLLKAAKSWLKPAVIIILSFIVIAFLGNKISETSSRIKETRIANAILQRRVDTIGSLEADLRQVGTANFEKLDRIIPTTDDIANLSLELINLARANNVTLMHSISSTLNPTGFDLKDPDYRLSTIDYSGTATASVSSIFRFLRALERSNYLLAIESISLTAPGEGWFASSSANIKGKLYVKQPIR